MVCCFKRVLNAAITIGICYLWLAMKNRDQEEQSSLLLLLTPTGGARARPSHGGPQHPRPEHRARGRRGEDAEEAAGRDRGGVNDTSI